MDSKSRQKLLCTLELTFTWPPAEETAIKVVFDEEGSSSASVLQLDDNTLIKLAR